MVWTSVFSKALQIHHHHHHDDNPEPHSPATLESAVMEETVSAAEAVVLKWVVDGGTTSSIFGESSSSSRNEAARFLSAFKDLQRAMQFFVGSRDRHGQEVLGRAHRLTQAAVGRLQKEFYQLLSANRNGPDMESLHRSSVSTATSWSSLEEDLGSLGVDDAEESSWQEIPSPSSSTATASSSPDDDSAQKQLIADLRAIAETMFAGGYSMECFKAYEVVRRSNVDEALFRLGFPRLAAAQLHRLGATAGSRLKSWPHAARSAVRSIFCFERALCDGVFGFSDDVRESAFAEVVSEGAAHLLAFPETAAKAVRGSPEKTFELLDAYTALLELMPEVDQVFSHASTAGVRTQAVRSLGKLAEAVRSAMGEFEDAVNRYASKGTVPGGAIHPLTRYVMNYLAFLADYGPALSQIFADHPLPLQKPLPENFFFPPTPPSSGATPPTSAPTSPSRSQDSSFDDKEATDAADPHGNVAPRVAWLVLVILCRLDAEAGHYKDNVPLAYLFLANNLAYVTSKVHTSGLRRLLGAEWVAKHQGRARQYVRTYEKLVWKNVIEAIPRDPSRLLPESAADAMRCFNAVFEDACRRQAGWVVPDARMREELKKSIARKVTVPYTEFYKAWREDPVVAGAVRSAPQDVWNHLSNLFCAASGSASRSVSPSRSSGFETSTASRWRCR